MASSCDVRKTITVLFDELDELTHAHAVGIHTGSDQR
jgi:hypothetical protein